MKTVFDSLSQEKLPRSKEGRYTIPAVSDLILNGESTSTICRRKYATSSDLDFLTGCCLFVGSCQGSALPSRFLARSRAACSSFCLFEVQGRRRWNGEGAHVHQ